MSTTSKALTADQEQTLATSYATLAGDAFTQFGGRAAYLAGLERRQMSSRPAGEQADWIWRVRELMRSGASERGAAAFGRLCDKARTEIEESRSQAMTSGAETSQTRGNMAAVGGMSTGWSTAAVLTTAVSAVALSLAGYLLMRGKEGGRTWEDE